MDEPWQGRRKASEIEGLPSPLPGFCTVLAVTGGSAAAQLALGYFLGVPPGRPVLRQSRRPELGI
jgi:hypothetical protein